MMTINLPCIVAVGERTVEAELTAHYCLDQDGQPKCNGLDVRMTDNDEVQKLMDDCTELNETLIQD